MWTIVVIGLIGAGTWLAVRAVQSKAPKPPGDGSPSTSVPAVINTATMEAEASAEVATPDNTGVAIESDPTTNDTIDLKEHL